MSDNENTSLNSSRQESTTSTPNKGGNASSSSSGSSSSSTSTGIPSPSPMSSIRPEPLSAERVSELAESMFTVLPLEEKKAVFAKVNREDGISYSQALEVLSNKVRDYYAEKSAAEVQKYVQQPLSAQTIDEYVATYFSVIEDEARSVLKEVGADFTEGEALKQLRQVLDQWRASHVFSVKLTNPEINKTVEERVNGEDDQSSLSWLDDRLPELTPGIYLRAVALKGNESTIPFVDHKVSWRSLEPNGTYDVVVEDTRAGIYRVDEVTKSQNEVVQEKFGDLAGSDGLVKISSIDGYLESWLDKKLRSAESAFKNENGGYDSQINEEAHKQFIDNFENSVADKKNFARDCDNYQRGALNRREFQLFAAYLKLWDFDKDEQDEQGGSSSSSS